MIYAPVLIPTLNRYEHFKETVTSLSQCTGADMTDLYIALDYPPSSFYEEGYKKIIDFLPSISGFKTVNVIKRETNYGVVDNHMDALHRVILTKYDRFIFSEDDNHFSPNFLEFINKGLERYKDDKSVIAVNGYRHFYNLHFADNNFFFQDIDFSAWGYGMTRDMRMMIERTITKKYFRRKFLNPINWWKLGRNGLNRFLQFFYFFAGSYDKPLINDGTLSVYMALNGMKVVMPSVSKVRNIGWDSQSNSFLTGNMPMEYAIKYQNQEIDNETSFDFLGDGFAYYSANRKAYKHETHDRLSFWPFLKTVCKKIIPGFKKRIAK